MDKAVFQKKIRITSDLFDLVMKIKSHQIKKDNPSLSDKEIRKHVIELMNRGS